MPTKNDHLRWAKLDIWALADELASSHEIRIDRPAGACHPKIREFVYPVDYGFLVGTAGGDGEGIDVWVGAEGHRVSGVVWTLDLPARNTEAKLLLGCTEHEIEAIRGFYEPQPQAALIIRRTDHGDAQPEIQETA